MSIQTRILCHISRVKSQPKNKWLTSSEWLEQIGHKVESMSIPLLSEFTRVGRRSRTSCQTFLLTFIGTNLFRIVGMSIVGRTTLSIFCRTDLDVKSGRPQITPPSIQRISDGDLP